MTSKRRPSHLLTFAWHPLDWIVLLLVALLGILIHMGVVWYGARQTAATCAALFMQSPEHIALLDEIHNLHNDVEQAHASSQLLSASLVQIQASMTQIDAGVGLCNRGHQDILSTLHSPRVVKTITTTTSTSTIPMTSTTEKLRAWPWSH